MTATLDYTSTSADNTDSEESRSLVGFKIIDLEDTRSDRIVPLFERFLGFSSNLAYPTELSVQHLWPRTGISILVIYGSQENRKFGKCDCLIICRSRTAWERAKEVLVK